MDLHDAVEAMAQRIRNTAGGDVLVHPSFSFPGYIQLSWTYDCPCGEPSQYALVFSHVPPHVSDKDFINQHTETALEAMRRHVRSEGNEPSF